MDQDTLVNEQIDSGKSLIDELNKAGFELQVAFWAKPSDEGQWFLYLSSPYVDEKGPAAAYRLVLSTVRNNPSLRINPFEIKVIGTNDSIAEAAMVVTKRKFPSSPFAVRNPKPEPGMTRYGGSTLGGVDIDGAFIYPLLQPHSSV
jgi:hypothetical protein